MGLVVEDDDVLRVAELAADAADHLGRRLAEAVVVDVAVYGRQIVLERVADQRAVAAALTRGNPK